MEEYERACCIQGYHEYKVLTALLMAFATLAFSTAIFAGWLLGLADMLTTILQDLKLFGYTLQTRRKIGSLWTLSLWKLGQIYIWWSGNWVIVGVNYIISVRFGTQKFASWLFMTMHNANLLCLSNLIGATTCQYACIIMPQFYKWMCPDPIFRQGRRAHVKNLVSGDETTLWLEVAIANEN